MELPPEELGHDKPLYEVRKNPDGSETMIARPVPPFRLYAGGSPAQVRELLHDWQACAKQRLPPRFRAKHGYELLEPTRSWPYPCLELNGRSRG